MNGPLTLLAFTALALAAEPAAAQSVDAVQPATPGTSVVGTPPSVGNGVANGVVKPSGAPSVGNGIANGAMKQAGSPSVGDGVANGTVKPSTIQQ